MAENLQVNEAFDKINEKTKQKLDELVEFIASLKTLEVSYLVDKIKSTLGISEDAVAFTTSPTAEKEEETQKTKISNVNLKISGLTETGEKDKIAAYKKLMEVNEALNGTNLQLLQAKKLVDTGSLLAENVPSNKAEQVKTDLEAAGIKVTLTPV